MTGRPFWIACVTVLTTLSLGLPIAVSPACAQDAMIGL
jgi:hypothetical protein